MTGWGTAVSFTAPISSMLGNCNACFAKRIFMPVPWADMPIKWALKGFKIDFNTLCCRFKMLTL